MWTKDTLMLLWMEVIGEFKEKFPHYSLLLRQAKFKPVVEDRRARWFGQCSMSNKTVSVNLCTHKHSTRENVVDTMLHEIAHAIDFCQRGESSHDKVWGAIAKEIGSNGQRVSKSPVKMQYPYVSCIHTKSNIVFGTGHNRKPSRTPIGVYLTGQWFTSNKEHTEGKIIVYSWKTWVSLCDEHGVSPYKEDHMSVKDFVDTDK